MEEEQLIEDRHLRDQMSGRYAVLDEVKKLLVIPGTDYMTAKQVAEYYVVGEEAVQSLYKDNREELDGDGVVVKGYKDFVNVLKGRIQIKQSKRTVVTFEDGKEMTLSRRGMRIFPRRAILRVGMLLRDSEIAKEIRSQLLNIEEKTSNKTKTEDIDTEQSLMLAVGMAFGSGNINALLEATTKYSAFQNRHIAKLEQDNKALASGNLEWSDRSTINFAIRKLSGLSGVRIQDLWRDLYQQLLYKHHINVKARGKQPWIQHVKESEWNAVNMVFASMCIAYGTTASDVLDQLKVK